MEMQQQIEDAKNIATLLERTEQQSISIAALVDRIDHREQKADERFKEVQEDIKDHQKDCSEYRKNVRSEFGEIKKILYKFLGVVSALVILIPIVLEFIRTWGALT